MSTPTAPDGYTPTCNLRFENGKLHQQWVSGHTDGEPKWLPVRDWWDETAEHTQTQIIDPPTLTDEV